MGWELRGQEEEGEGGRRQEEYPPKLLDPSLKKALRKPRVQALNGGSKQVAASHLLVGVQLMTSVLLMDPGMRTAGLCLQKRE